MRRTVERSTSSSVTRGAAVVAVVALGFGGVAAAAGSDEQDRADAAIAAFAERVESLGFVSSGPQSESDEDFFDLTDLDNVPEECAELVEVFAAFEDGFADELANAESDEYEFAIDGEMADATGEIGDDTGEMGDADFDFDLSGESISAIVVIVDDPDAARLVDLVEAFTSDAMTGCFAQMIEEEMAADMDGDGGDDEFAMDFPAPTIEIGNNPDLGVGDASGSLGIQMEMWLFFPIVFDATFALATADDVLVMVIHATFNLDEAPSGIDPIEELEALLADAT